MLSLVIIWVSLSGKKVKGEMGYMAGEVVLIALCG
jgi:hypothetical protein